ncbi:fimbrial protein [Pseudomonas chlororaphis subsp. aurantiaca]|uniref:fimbrial protein n=1 Tax=Pseudomonas chlororaphis TaxID=587753 RepID=UPI0027DC7EFD|nr:fimbrial protein [Pseudomonas chlororaphis]WMI97536.1 fimbrial protein [Pseudomonas chlororaphis subsp. aurantiaca]
MFKKRVAVALFLGVTVSGTASAFDGTINFTGNISDAACTVGSSVPTVRLGHVAASALGSVGDRAGSTRFEVKLTTCPTTLTKAAIKFDGPSDSNNTELLALTTEAGVAKGVAIGFFENDGATKIPVGEESTLQDINPTTHEATLVFFAKYQRTAPLVEGKANASTTFTIIYN